MLVVKSQVYKGPAHRYGYGGGLYCIRKPGVQVGKRGRRNEIVKGGHYFKDGGLASVSKCFNFLTQHGGVVTVNKKNEPWVVRRNPYARSFDPAYIPIYSERADVSSDYIVYNGVKLYANLIK